MIWGEGVDVRLRSCSNSHIDIVVNGEGGAFSWRATGFYGHPNAKEEAYLMRVAKDAEKSKHAAMIRLDRVVADERWVAHFPEAQVQHISMSTSYHCLLALFLRKKRPIKSTKRRFMFEDIWVRDERCRGMIESVCAPTQASVDGCIVDKSKMCQSQLT